MSRKTIITCIENILPVFHTNLKHNLNQKNYTIFTNKYASTLKQNRQQISDIKRLKNSRFIYNYQSAIHFLKKNNQSTQKVDQISNQILLVIGDPHHKLHKQLKNLRIITLQQMCGLFPQKVPLSYRSKQNQKLRQQIEKRTKISLKTQPHISHILYTSHNIKMWDEAIQLILDHQPAQNIIEFQRPLNNGNNQNGHYKLTMRDFLQASKVSYKLVHNHQLPQIVDFNTNNRHIEWIIQDIKRKTNKDGKGDTIVVDEDLVDDVDQLSRRYPQQIWVERVDENSSLWG